MALSIDVTEFHELKKNIRKPIKAIDFDGA